MRLIPGPALRPRTPGAHHSYKDDGVLQGVGVFHT